MISMHRLFRLLGVFLISLLSIVAIFIVHNERIFSQLNPDSISAQVATFLVTMEEQFYDKRSSFLYQHQKIQPDITMLLIDEESLKKIGRWPWTRTVWAKVLDKLNHFGAKIVAFDVLFSEPEKVCNEASPDTALASAIKRFQEKPGNKVILSYYLTDLPEEALKDFPPQLLFSVVNGQANNASIQNFVSSTTMPIPPLLDTDPSLGFIAAIPSSDGVFRRVPLVGNFEQNIFPSLGFATFKEFFSNEKNTVSQKIDSIGTASIEIQREGNPTPERTQINHLGEIRLRFFGGTTNFNNISISHLLEAKANDPVMKSTFTNKVVFIGSTATAAHDLRHTPIDPVLPGVYFHANTFHMLQNNFFFKPTYESYLVSLWSLAVGVILLILVMSLSSPILHAAALVMILSTVFFLDRFFFLPQGYTLSLLFILLTIMTSYSWMTIFDFISMSRERKKIKDAFTRYVAPEIVKEMLAHPELLRVGGQKKNISMLFSDIRDFTSFSEKLSPQDLATLLNKYMGVMTDILFNTHGTLDKYIGDAIVGFWGAPLHVPNHPVQAIRGALQMVETVPLLNEEFKKMNFPSINIGVGINTGDVSVGNMGSDKIFAYTALGDNMNLASRLEGLTKNYGVNLLISEFTYEALGNSKKDFIIRPVDLVRVKGKQKAVGIFEPLHANHNILSTPGLINLYMEAFYQYKDKKFSSAHSIFTEILAKAPQDKLSKIHLANIEEYLKNPPPEDWDGVTTFTTK